MSIKIIEKSPFADTKYEATCSVCGTKAEYEYPDIQTEITSFGEEIVFQRNYIQCPYCNTEICVEIPKLNQDEQV
jgi:hypothetical protein